MQDQYDVVIVGASFAGLSLAHHLPSTLRVLVIDVKPAPGSSVESTGLITEHTRQEFLSFFSVDQYITNKISAICVVSPNYTDFFESHTESPWIYQTDTKKLVRALADSTPEHVDIEPKTAFVSSVPSDQGRTVTVFFNGEKKDIQTRFLVGADGGHSAVAKSIPELSQQQKFLFGYEEVHLGEVMLGNTPAETIYHFWFGEFSLGYGGWLSPTYMNDQPGFRVGLAKYPEDRGKARQLLKDFLDILTEKKIITITGDVKKPEYVFGSHIPIGGVQKQICSNNVLLIGDAAGFCGAFAADGIKGSVISGKEAAPLIAKYLDAPYEGMAEQLLEKINMHNKLIAYYKKQMWYRWLWNQMKRDRTFMAMYSIIQCEKEGFLHQFCDSKDRQKSLTGMVLKVKYIPKLVRYGVFVLWDMVFGRGR